MSIIWSGRKRTNSTDNMDFDLAALWLMILLIDIWKAADFDRSLFNMTRRQPRFSSWKKTLACCHTTPLCVLFGIHGGSCVFGFEPAGPIVASLGVTAHQTHLKGCRESKLQSCKQQSRTISPWFITHRLFIFNVNRRSVMAAAKKRWRWQAVLFYLNIITSQFLLSLESFLLSLAITW